jgi:ABC-type oligopeptide transport system ATPase subunit
VALVEIRNLTKVFPVVRAVDDVSLDIEAGETLGLIGESGSGKSTLGRLILRLLEPTSGSIVFAGKNLVNLTQGGQSSSKAELRLLRRDMQIIFQDPFASLDPRFRVEDIIAEPLIIHREIGHRDVGPAIGAGQAGAGIRSRVSELLRAVGLDESARLRYPHEFSGGQRQRIGIARALILKPDLIIADEPVSALDVSVGAQVLLLLRELQQEFHLTYVFISHSLPVVAQLATHIAVMRAGQFVEFGPAERVLRQPSAAYTQELLAAVPEIPRPGRV